MMSSSVCAPGKDAAVARQEVGDVRLVAGSRSWSRPFSSRTMSRFAARSSGVMPLRASDRPANCASSTCLRSVSSSSSKRCPRVLVHEVVVGQAADLAANVVGQRLELLLPSRGQRFGRQLLAQLLVVCRHRARRRRCGVRAARRSVLTMSSSSSRTSARTSPSSYCDSSSSRASAIRRSMLVQAGETLLARRARHACRGRAAAPAPRRGPTRPGCRRTARPADRRRSDRRAAAVPSQRA